VITPEEVEAYYRPMVLRAQRANKKLQEDNTKLRAINGKLRRTPWERKYRSVVTQRNRIVKRNKGHIAEMYRLRRSIRSINAAVAVAVARLGR